MNEIFFCEILLCTYIYVYGNHAKREINVTLQYQIIELNIYQLLLSSIVSLYNIGLCTDKNNIIGNQVQVMRSSTISDIMKPTLLSI